MIKIPVHKGSILEDTITVGGYKFFYHGDLLRCATCLFQMGLQAEPMVKGEIRRLVIIKDCDCPKQK